MDGATLKVIRKCKIKLYRILDALPFRENENTWNTRFIKKLNRTLSVFGCSVYSLSGFIKSAMLFRLSPGLLQNVPLAVVRFKRIPFKIQYTFIQSCTRSPRRAEPSRALRVGS